MKTAASKVPWDQVGAVDKGTQHLQLRHVHSTLMPDCCVTAAVFAFLYYLIRRFFFT